MQFQKRIIGYHRKPMNTAVIDEIENALNKCMRVNDVSRSFIIAVALADFFGIDEQQRFVEKVNYNKNKQHVSDKKSRARKHKIRLVS